MSAQDAVAAESNAVPSRLPSAARAALRSPLTWVVIAASVLPIALQTFGVDFSTQFAPGEFSIAPGSAPSAVADQLHYALRGSFTHTLLEWSAVCAAVFTAVLAFAHFRITRSIVTPVIGIMLLWSAGMDAFHTLAADRLIHASTHNADLIPFTWAICRCFNALIVIVGIGFLMKSDVTQSGRRSFRFLCGLGLLIGVGTYAIIHLCATSSILPRTMFPDALRTRPWDIAPLLLYALAGFWLLPRFYKQQPNIFVLALCISTIPNMATQAHMAFGSVALFDHHFNVAHALKVVAYLVPAVGLILDYVASFQREARMREEVREQSRVLKRRAIALERTNAELEQFAYVASHDLQEPLRMVSNFTELLRKRYADQLDEDAQTYIHYSVEGAQRMQRLVRDLLLLSRTGRSDEAMVDVDTAASCKGALFNLRSAIQEAEAVITVDQLPDVRGVGAELTQLFQNLIGNAIKFRGEAAPVVSVGAKLEQDMVVFTVSDNGIGIAPEHQKRVFQVFQRLHTRETYPGTGIGLSVCQKIVTNRGGQISVDSRPGRGTTFTFSLPAAGANTHRQAAVETTSPSTPLALS